MAVLKACKDNFLKIEWFFPLHKITKILKIFIIYSKITVLEMEKEAPQRKLCEIE